MVSDGKGQRKCLSCGSHQSECRVGEELTLLYMAAQKLRASDFDEAEQTFDDLICKYPENHNGYWGRLMATHGIKYEEDYNGSKIPTCYDASIESIQASSDYAKAIELADEESRLFYRNQADYIEQARREWIEKAKKEPPCDIFLSYKESDTENGIPRTKDSYAVQDLYVYLKDKGYRVFYSRESLRGKTGEKYEPYIFAALSTAKVMLIYGTKPEYIRSVWVKNEWTRYGKRIQTGEKQQGSLLVACDGFSPYELPRALAGAQCFDANDRRFYGDLTDTIERILGLRAPVHKPKPVKKAVNPKKYSDGLRYIYDHELDGWSVMDIGTCKDKKLVIPGTAKDCVGIGSYAFQFNGDQLTDIVILDGITHIGDGAFYTCNRIKNVILPETLVKIGNSAFRDCQGLTEIEIPEGTESIEDLAFLDCTALKKAVIPDTVTSLGKQAFQNCGALESLTLSSSLEEIPDHAFCRCVSLKSIELPRSLHKIGIAAFSDCAHLESVTVPEGVTAIEASAFCGCKSLRDVTVLGNIKKISECAFCNCEELTHLVLPSSLESIEYSAFHNCKKLKSIEFRGTKAQWKKVEKGWLRKDNSAIRTVDCSNGKFRFLF